MFFLVDFDSVWIELLDQDLQALDLRRDVTSLVVTTHDVDGSLVSANLVVRKGSENLTEWPDLGSM